MTETTASALLDRYDAFLIDAYGVLVDSGGPLPHAAEFVHALQAAGKRRLLVTNDASRTAGDVVARLQRFGIGLNPDEVLTSGMMIAPWVAEHALHGRATIVLGPEGSQALAADAGLDPVAPDDPAAEALLVCDEAGFDFLPTLEAVLTTAVQRLSSGRPMHLGLPNPDVLYPKPGARLGLAAGAVAAVIERGLRARLGPDAPTFERLGKPHPPIFNAALRHVASCPPAQVVMLGDQLETDIAGAAAAGLDAALVETGISRRPPPTAALVPTWVLTTLSV